jgi:hypothetical protein
MCDQIPSFYDFPEGFVRAPIVTPVKRCTQSKSTPDDGIVVGYGLLLLRHRHDGGGAFVKELHRPLKGEGSIADTAVVWSVQCGTAGRAGEQEIGCHEF